MLVAHLRKEFMDLLTGHRVIIIAYHDADSACTVKIITSLFKTEGVAYVLVSCTGLADLKVKYAEYSTQSDVFLLVNCGATVDLLHLLDDPDVDKKLFVLDSHRPIDIINYYDTKRIRLLSGPEEDDKIPHFDQLFAVDEEVSSDSESEEDEEMDGMEARDRNENRAERRRRRREWAEARERTLFSYREHSYYARPSALHALEIAWMMSRDDMESIWCAIVALTDYLVQCRLSRSKYRDFVGVLHNHILRVTHSEKLPRDCLKIKFQRELYLFLYRSWTIYDSVKATPYSANHLRTWSKDGERKFHQMLAYMGLPLCEVKQKYLNMSGDLRTNLVEMFQGETVKEKYKLPDLVFASFVAEYGFRSKFNALDNLMAMLAVMENPDGTKTEEDKFLEAMKLLNVKDAEAFRLGVEKAKQMLELLQQHVQMMVDQKQMQEIGPFIVLQLSEGLIDFNYFKRPSSIPLLVNYLQHAGVKCGKRKWRECPWVVMIPQSAEFFVAVGLQPGAYHIEIGTVKNIFFEVFRVIKNKMPDDVVLDWYEGGTMLVKTASREKFMGELLSISE